MVHEDILGLPLEKARGILGERGIQVDQVIWTCAPKSPQLQGSARVVALRKDGRILVAARFLDGMIRV